MHYATPSDVRSAAQEWTAGQLACRSSRNHHWAPLTAVHDKRLHYIRETQRCLQCGNTRTREINERGYVLVPWQTHHEEGYRMPPGTGRIDEDGMAFLRIAALGLIEVETIKRKADSDAMLGKGKRLLTALEANNVDVQG